MQLAIMQYLEETRPQNALLPQDVHMRAKVREICQMIASGIQPLQNVGLLEHLAEEKRIGWVAQWINRGFKGQFSHTNNLRALS
jgi:maleylacetoacetate isomerase